MSPSFNSTIKNTKWWISLGIDDNGSGCACLLEMARAVTKLGKITNPLRFAFWGGEEDGLVWHSRCCWLSIFLIQHTNSHMRHSQPFTQTHIHRNAQTHILLNAFTLHAHIHIYCHKHIQNYMLAHGLLSFLNSMAPTSTWTLRPRLAALRALPCTPTMTWSRRRTMFIRLEAKLDNIKALLCLIMWFVSGGVHLRGRGHVRMRMLLRMRVRWRVHARARRVHVQVRMCVKKGSKITCVYVWVWNFAQLFFFSL